MSRLTAPRRMSTLSSTLALVLLASCSGSRFTADESLARGSTRVTFSLQGDAGVTTLQLDAGESADPGSADPGSADPGSADPDSADPPSRDAPLAEAEAGPSSDAGWKEKRDAHEPKAKPDKDKDPKIPHDGDDSSAEDEDDEDD